MGKTEEKVNEMRRILDECKRNGGLAQYGEQGAFEIILKYIFNVKKPEKISKELFNNHDSIKEVLSSDINDFFALKGMSFSQSRNLIYLDDVFRANYSKKPINVSFSTLESSVEFCRMLFRTCTKEKILIVYINDKKRTVYLEETTLNLYEYSQFDIRNITKNISNKDIKKILIAHNHPNKETLPSSQDSFSTRRIATLLRELGIYFLDHIIISGKSYYSFRKSGYLDGILD